MMYMIAHDSHKLTVVNFSEYGPRQALIMAGWVYLWLGREGFLTY